MFKKILLSIGSLLFLASLILAVFVGIRMLGGARFNLRGEITSMIIIGCPMLVGTILVIASVSDEMKRKAIILVESLSLFMYAVVVFMLVFGGFRIVRMGHLANVNLTKYIILNSNFIPFKTIFFYLKCLVTGEINRTIAIANLVGNFMMFMPAGLLLPAIFNRQRKWSCFLFTIVSLLIGIEVIQIVFRLGTFDIDDFILNIAGVCIIYGIIRIDKINYFLKKILIL